MKVSAVLSCKAVRSEIEEALGFAPVGREARAHIDACRECRDFYDGRVALGRLARGLEKVSAPADFEFRLRARMSGAKTAGRGLAFRRPRFATGFTSLAVAACFLVASASLYLRQGGETRRAVGQREAQTSAPSSEVRAAKVAKLEPEVVSAKKVDELPEESVGQPSSENSAPPNSSSVRASEVVMRNTRKGRGADKTASFGLRQAPVINAADLRRGRELASRSTMLAIPLRTSSEPLRLVLRDESGAAQVVPVRAVSFGAQELVARKGGVSQPTGKDKEGVW